MEGRYKGSIFKGISYAMCRCTWCFLYMGAVLEGPVERL